MNKKTILYALLDSVFVVVFNIIFFVLGGTQHPLSVWLSYGFIHLAYVMVIATPLLLRQSRSRAVMGFSLYSVSAAYFLVEFAVGLVFVLLRSESYKIALVLQVLLGGVYAVLLLTNLIANETTAENEQRQEAEVFFIKDAASRVKMLIGRIPDPTVDKALEAAYDLLHSSPSKSHTSVAVIELEIKQFISELETAVANDATADVALVAQKLTVAVEERNRRLKMV